MKTKFDRVDGIITVAEALHSMKHPETRCLIVNKRHSDDEFGIVLLSDIARHVLAKNRSPKRVNIYEIMVKPVLSVSPKMDIRYCARLFDRFDILRAPVIENDDIQGIVSFSNIVLHGMNECCR
ncbi:MAG: CBS domain-containing protein [Bacteroidales bacterium]|nr:CBS domain-containing protein [Bacteroidales bacterium]